MVFKTRVFAACALLGLSAVSAASAASWSAPAAYESVANASVGTGVTGWDASVSVSFDVSSSSGAAGDDAGWADVTVTSALYGDFSASHKMVLASLPDARYPDCSGAFAAVLPSGVRVSSAQWDGLSGQPWGWVLDGSYFCFQNPGADKPLKIFVS